MAFIVMLKNKTYLDQQKKQHHHCIVQYTVVNYNF
jgi:hypothetical protein